MLAAGEPGRGGRDKRRAGVTTVATPGGASPHRARALPEAPFVVAMVGVGVASPAFVVAMVGVGVANPAIVLPTSLDREKRAGPLPVCDIGST